MVVDRARADEREAPAGAPGDPAGEGGADDAVVVAGEVDAVRATRHDLDDLCDEVVGWVRVQAPGLAEKYGGRAPEGLDEEDDA